MGPAQVRNLRHGVVKEGGKKRIAGEPCVAYHRVGGVDGLALQCRPPTTGQEIGSRSWVLIATVGLRRREIGLGGYPDVSLGEARELARQKRPRSAMA
ncbi:Arm DNA-binding domain-containing protein [Marinobacter sp. SS8-8]|uniref:Arm DNA-binding domain-containing protein n=1 Tax=Marinobacter sp. SS8-8 TaxID=3050452 RepID=UPI0034A13B47